MFLAQIMMSPAHRDLGSSKDGADSSEGLVTSTVVIIDLKVLSSEN